MERLTHEADFGVEDWEQILYRVPADPEGAYNIFDIAERWVHYDDADCGCILQDITRKLRDYENIAPKVDELYLKKCQEVSELTKRMRWIPVKERLLLDWEYKKIKEDEKKGLKMRLLIAI